MFKMLFKSFESFESFRIVSEAIKITIYNKKIELRKKIAEHKINRQTQKEIDTFPFWQMANYLLGEDAALDRISTKDKIRLGVIKMPPKSKKGLVYRLSSKLACVVLGYKEGATIIKTNKEKFDCFSSQQYKIVAIDSNYTVVLQSYYSEYPSKNYKTVEQLVNEGYIVE